MALFRAQVKPISRSKGHNAVAAAAYRAGEELTDKNKYNANAMTHDFSKKTDVMYKNIILPTQLAEQNFEIERQDLWSKVEEHEVTKKDQTMKANARVAREWLLALPHELSDQENIELAEEFAQKMADDLGVIADCCIHHPGLLKFDAPKPSYRTADKDDKKDNKEDHRNIHAHIMFTTRIAELNAANELIFTDKADSELDGTARKNKGLAKEADYIKAVRAEWAEMVNKRLLEHGIKEVSSLSYKDRKLDILPQVHTGRDSQAEDKREHNDDIIRRNELVFNSRAATVERFADTANASTRINDNITEINGKFEKYTSERVEYSERASANTDKRIEYSERYAESYDESAEIFNQLTERANKINAERRSGLVEQAIQKYKDATDLGIPKMSSWGNAGQQHKEPVSPRYRTRLEFNDRQLDIIDNIREHLQPKTTYFNDEKLRESLSLQENKHILTLLTDPKSEQEQYSKNEEDNKKSKTLSEAHTSVLSSDSYDSIIETAKEPDKSIESTRININTPKFRR